MTRAEQAEYQRIVNAMACHPDSIQVAKMGQGFHAHLQDKYGKDYASDVSSDMMEAVYRLRTGERKMVYQPTGEVIE